MRQETTSENIGAAGTAPERGEPGRALPPERAGEQGATPDLPPDQLEDEIVTLVGRLTSATYDLLVLIGELDHRGTWALSGALSCAAWLAHHCDLELVTARNQVRVARAMREHPVLAAAMASGDVSYANARALVPHLSAEHTDELVDLAASTPATGLGAAIARWSHGHESDEEIDARHHEERSVSWRTDADGMVRITARLTPEDAAAVCACIDKTVTVTSAPTGASDGATPAMPSLVQQRADALVQLVSKEPATGSSGDSSRAVTTEIVVHVAEDGNTLPDGTPLTDHAVAGLLPEGFVSLLMHDAKRQPIDASPRRRFPTRRQRRVVDSKQRTCQHPGCDATVFLQYDHIDPYTDGGSTVVANLQRLCGPHNRAKNATSPPRSGAAA